MRYASQGILVFAIISSRRCLPRSLDKGGPPGPDRPAPAKCGQSRPFEGALVRPLVAVSRECLARSPDSGSTRRATALEAGRYDGERDRGKRLPSSGSG